MAIINDPADLKDVIRYFNDTNSINPIAMNTGNQGKWRTFLTWMNTTNGATPSFRSLLDYFAQMTDEWSTIGNIKAYEYPNMALGMSDVNTPMDWSKLSIFSGKGYVRPAGQELQYIYTNGTNGTDGTTRNPHIKLPIKTEWGVVGVEVTFDSIKRTGDSGVSPYVVWYYGAGMGVETDPNSTAFVGCWSWGGTTNPQVAVKHPGANSGNSIWVNTTVGSKRVGFISKSSIKLSNTSGAVIQSKTPSYTRALTPQYLCFLSGVDYGTSGWVGAFSGKFYGAKIFSATSPSTIYAEIVPWKDDNKVGLYDIKNGVFYTNAGSGTIYAGPTV